MNNENSDVMKEVAFLKNLVSELSDTLNQRMSVLESELSKICTTCNDVLLQTGIIIKECNEHMENSSNKHYERISNQLNALYGSVNHIHDVVYSAYSSKSAVANDKSSVLVKIPESSPTTKNSHNPEWQVLTLNNEEDYPHGSWLGDENLPESRVRVPISPGDLQYINTNCKTPEKMALTLMDYLFPRKVLATSNISGRSKHGKTQLDPLFIYGIRCQLVQKFNITEKRWSRVKMNMDSKCRTIWKRKTRGMSIGMNRADENLQHMVEVENNEDTYQEVVVEADKSENSEDLVDQIEEDSCFEIASDTYDEAGDTHILICESTNSEEENSNSDEVDVCFIQPTSEDSIDSTHSAKKRKVTVSTS